MGKPVILITNDDGNNAPGLRYLIDTLRNMAKLYVVASEYPMSGQGHAITVRAPLRLHPVDQDHDYAEYSCNGTPVDCIKLGKNLVIGGKPDLVVSGINHGSNAAVNIVYSGTMAAVIEACIDGIPAIGFSLTDYSRKADFSHCDTVVKSIVKNVLEQGLPEDTCLNVNIPAVNGTAIRGVKVCRQAKARWIETFDSRKDPANKDYHWLTGEFYNRENQKDTDQWALDNNYVSVVPVHFDFTAHKALDHIQKWKFNEESD